MPEKPSAEPTSPPSLLAERAIRAEIQRCLDEDRTEDALAKAEVLLRDAYPRQLDLFREYGRLCLHTGRLQQGFDVLWKAAECIERRSPYHGVKAWLSLASLAPTDVRPLRRAAGADRDPRLGRSAGLARGDLRAGYARLVAAGLLAEAESLQAEAGFPLEPTPPEPIRPEEGAPREPSISAPSGLVRDESWPGDAGNPGQPPVVDRRFEEAASPQTWREIARGLREAGELVSADYATRRASHVERHPGCVSGPPSDAPGGAPQARVLLFPPAEVGTVSMRARGSEGDWRSVKACGLVVVPAGWDARFGFKDYFVGCDPKPALEVLERLGPHDLQQLGLVDQRVDDEALAAFARLPFWEWLRELSLVGTDLACSGALDDMSMFLGVGLDQLGDQIRGYGPTDEGMRHVAAASELRELDVSIGGVGDRGVEHLQRLEHLEILSLKDTSVTDQGLAVLARCRTLRALDLSGTHITPEGLRLLVGLPCLEALDVSGVYLKSVEGGLFGAFPALRELHAARTAAPISAFKGCQSLDSVDLSGHGLEDEDTLLGLADLPRLQTVYLTHMRGDVGAAVCALRKKAGSRLKVVRNRTVGFLGRGGSFQPQEPEE